MSTTAFEDFEVLEQQVREMVDQHHLPAPISGFDVKFGEMRDGDPAVWIRLHVPARDHVSDVEARVYADLILELSRELRRLVPGRSAFTTIINEQGSAA